MHNLKIIIAISASLFLSGCGDNSSEFYNCASSLRSQLLNPETLELYDISKRSGSDLKVYAEALYKSADTALKPIVTECVNSGTIIQDCILDRGNDLLEKQSMAEAILEELKISESVKFFDFRFKAASKAGVKITNMGHCLEHASGAPSIYIVAD